MPHYTKKQAIKRFEQAFTRKFGQGANFSHQDADPDEDLVESIHVSVPLDGRFEWEDIEPGVVALLKSSGASRYFETGGAGTGFGFRDVSMYRK